MLPIGKAQNQTRNSGSTPAAAKFFEENFDRKILPTLTQFKLKFLNSIFFFNKNLQYLYIYLNNNIHYVT